MSTMDVKNYDALYQMHLLTQVVNAPDVYVRCKNILKPEFFDTNYKKGIQYILDYTRDYSTIPALSDISIKTGLTFIREDVNPLHHDSILKDVAEYCRHRALENAIIEGSKLVQQKKYGMIESLIRDAMLISLQSDLGLDIYENPEDVINSLATMQGTFKTGWETLDFKLFGGFGRQELEIFAAASGGGKSVVLQNLAVNFSKQGLKGVYITLELAKELVAVRIYGMMLDTAIQKVKTDVDETTAKLKVMEHSNGTLRVHRMPESITTVNDIEAYIQQLQITTGEKLDYICVDYLDLLTSDSCDRGDNAFIKDKFVSEELRGLARKMDLTVFTACQFNRNGVDADQKSQSQIAGGISKIYTADNVIYLDAHKERGEMIFDFQKTRNSSAVGSKLRMSYNIDSLRVLDHEQTIAEMELNTAFRWSGNGTKGAGNVYSTPTANTMMTLQNNLQKPGSTGNTSLNTNTPDKASSVRDFLNNRSM